jgi:hypothetical protein
MGVKPGLPPWNVHSKELNPLHCNNESDSRGKITSILGDAEEESQLLSNNLAFIFQVVWNFKQLPSGSHSLCFSKYCKYKTKCITANVVVLAKEQAI